MEQEQADLEYEIRVSMAQPERNKTDTDKAREEILIERLIEVVSLRNQVIDCLEMDRLREAEEDQVREICTFIALISYILLNTIYILNYYCYCRVLNNVWNYIWLKEIKIEIWKWRPENCLKQNFPRKKN